MSPYLHGGLCKPGFVVAGTWPYIFFGWNLLDNRSQQRAAIEHKKEGELGEVASMSTFSVLRFARSSASPLYSWLTLWLLWLQVSVTTSVCTAGFQITGTLREKGTSLLSSAKHYAAPDIQRLFWQTSWWPLVWMRSHQWGVIWHKSRQSASEKAEFLQSGVAARTLYYCSRFS